MCEYCESSKAISERDKLASNDSTWIGIGVYIGENILSIDACTDYHGVTGYIEKTITINFCPMCGRKLSGN